MLEIKLVMTGTVSNWICNESVQNGCQWQHNKQPHLDRAEDRETDSGDDIFLQSIINVNVFLSGIIIALKTFGSRNFRRVSRLEFSITIKT